MNDYTEEDYQNDLRTVLQVKEPVKIVKDGSIFPAFAVGATILLALAILLFRGCDVVWASEYTDEQIVNAIYKAEGGANAKYPYGIRSVECDTRSECLKVCRTTVKRNRQRFAEYGQKSFPDFLSFLASRYAPIGAGNDPKKLNQNWLKNVKYFLARSK